MDKTELYNNYKDYVKSKIARYTSEYHLIDDYVQEVFIKAFDAIDRGLFDDKNICGWLATIAKNYVLDQHKKKTIKPLNRDDSGFIENYWALSNYMHEEYDYTHEERIESITQAVDNIKSDDVRNVFVQHNFEGVKLVDIVKETGTPLGTILARNSYAKKHIRKELGITINTARVVQTSN